ncbi:hypothetical protein OUZ56_012308 [Daphnia magna]|uniref:Uncharacterized protein n=1 Tax=Daphnia magna TaxID=35525 RepID=A0ABQ9Z2M1_9CRUS|nr:hypothetical protein OUZ56_012308 [Daphnia magna]
MSRNDNAYKILSSSGTRKSYASVAGGNHQEEKAILIAEATKPIDIGMMDNFLSSKLNGPITQIVHQKESKVALTFSDVVSRAVARRSWNPLRTVKRFSKPHKDTNEGHVKLWLTSKAVKEELLKRAEIFLPT